jgi:hypothetical protein
MSTLNPYYYLYKIRMSSQKAKEGTLFLNKEQLEKFNFQIGQKLELVVGFTTLSVSIMEQDFDNTLAIFYLSPNIYTKLIYYQGEALCLTYFSPTTIVLGITLAIITSPKTFKKISKSKVLRARALLALKKGIVFYCICQNSVDQTNNILEAFILDSKNNLWVKKRLPPPQVFYTRSFFTRKHFLDKLWINSVHFFDKWSIYQALSSCPDTASFQPQTDLLSLDNLADFLQKYKFVFIKNIYGRCGCQVVRVEKNNKHFFCKSGGKKIKVQRFQSLNGLYKYVKNTLGSNLIIQQGISLKRLNNHPFDMRVLVQKNINGQWHLTAVSLRIAKPQAIVTNVAQGAKEVVLTPPDKLPWLSWEKLWEYSLKSLASLERKFGPLGEVGLDIALDMEGRLWLLEADSHPSSKGYLEAAPKEVCNQIFGLPLDYAKYLVHNKYKSQS